MDFYVFLKLYDHCELCGVKILCANFNGTIKLSTLIKQGIFISCWRIASYIFLVLFLFLNDSHRSLVYVRAIKMARIIRAAELIHGFFLEIISSKFYIICRLLIMHYYYKRAISRNREKKNRRKYRRQKANRFSDYYQQKYGSTKMKARKTSITIRTKLKSKYGRISSFFECVCVLRFSFVRRAFIPNRSWFFLWTILFESNCGKSNFTIIAPKRTEM